MDKTLEDILKMADLVIAPNGVINTKVFGIIFDKWSEFVAEAVCFTLEGDALNSWSEASMKHKVFSYIPEKRIRPTWPPMRNDLPQALAWAISQQEPDRQKQLVLDLEQDLVDLVQAGSSPGIIE